MSEQRRLVVIVDEEIQRAERTALLVSFLGFDSEIVSSEEDFRSLYVQQLSVMAIFISDDVFAKYRQLKNSSGFVSNNSPRCVCYLVETGTSNGRPSGGAETGQQGVISFPISYEGLFGALHEAELISNAASDSVKIPAAPLFRGLDGSSREIHFVRELTRQVAGTEASVLILGESGTGKEIVARNVHALSSRSKCAFVPINCGAIPSELLESELFGHEKGAFTGAVSARQGRFEMAEGGTLFLDEIGDMPLNMQVKLLRFLQERTFERVGSNKSIRANVRIVAATHQHLEQLVAEGKFRMDLYYRLNVFPIDMPPLRKRTEDIPLLVDAFANRMALDNRASVRLNDCALAVLTQYSWPGNARELFNLLERLAILYPRQLVKWSDLPEKFRPNQDWVTEQLEVATGRPNAKLPQTINEHLRESGMDLKTHLAGIECDLMMQALEQCDWVVARAAKQLNLRRTTLVEKMRKFSINKPEEMSTF